MVDFKKRAALYLLRKKGKAITLFLLFFLISALLLIGFSILSGTEQAAKDLRSNIGAAFYIRPYEEMNFTGGQISSTGTPVITNKAIEEVISAAGDELKAYNTEHYGYAKDGQLAFIPGAGHSDESNMGQVTAVRSSALYSHFLDEEYTLLEGRHIEPEDENKILISQELAAYNHLQVGDEIELTHAKLTEENGVYTDAIPEKTAFAKAEIIGIYQIENPSDDPAVPTAGKGANHILSDNRLLVNLQEQQAGVYEGEIAFYITDPLELDEILEKVEAVSSVDWNNHILRENDFQYEKIAGQLQNLQKLVFTLIIISSVLGIAVLALLLTMQIRGRVQEAGILLAIGKSKKEIIGQFALEKIILLLFGFLAAFVLLFPLSDLLNQLLFSPLLVETPASVLAGNEMVGNYLQPQMFHALLLLLGEAAAVLFAVIAASGAVLSLKPKEILSRMS